uniref:RNA-directed DNA polymerase, eukaryota n=1 Tax=Tanacetum cinerariifolium TaxID=118510 RepID=A0A699IDD1_TANCI|nr:hypothetical protein [Tanacetum cinerariifolium]
MIDLRADEELKDSIMVAMSKLVGVPVDPNVSIKSTKQIYKLVSNKNGASTSCKRKQAEVSRQEDSNSNSFDALNSIKNDDDLGTNVAHGSSSNTPIVNKNHKLKRQVLDGKLMFVNDDGNPCVPTCNVDSDSEVKVVFDETANLMASTSLDVSFRRPPRGGVELQQFEHMKEKVERCILVDMMDRWFWDLEGLGEFTITSFKKMINDFMLPEVSSKTR